MTDLTNATWRKSSYSGSSGGQCVEVATNLSGTVALRDSKNVPGPELAISDQSWSEFVQAIKNGEFDL
jgi:hypothetical protein